VLGLALMAREVEQQTTVLAWSLSPSRIAWLLRRVIPAGLGLLTLGLVAGGLGEMLESLRSPAVDPLRSLDQLGARGASVAAAPLMAFGISIAVGALLGKQLPTLLVASGLIVGLLFGIGQLTDAWLRGDSLVAVQADLVAGDRSLDGLIRTPEGEFIGWEEAYGRFGSNADLITMGMGDSIETSANGYVYAARYVPGELYPIADARIGLLAGGIGLLSIGASAFVVNRRRPY
jgi:hypothetical protein